MKVALGSDHAGFRLKEIIREELRSRKVKYTDYGTFCENSVDYPDISLVVAEAVRGGEFDCGILVCGTGIGMAIAANKYSGIRAAVCSDSYSVRCSREHNDANILALGARVIGPGLALDLVDTFISTPFGEGRHRQRLAKIALLEKRGQGKS